ncbi:MAG: HD domain-containing protein [Clostridia bacterium]|nr:HD domain-containing protein [Clostridia bacterium]
MNLTCKQALQMLEEAKGKAENDNWIYHSICVGNSAGKIAEALNLDVSKAKTLGYLHDIGKLVGNFQNHVMNGYYYLKELGYDDEICNICLTHSYLNNDCMCTAGGIPRNIPFRTEFIKNHEYTIYEKIINLCDLMCTRNVNTIDKRLIDIIKRRGAYENTQYHVKETYKLKAYFDELLGYNLYDLFPEIKEHL